MKTIGILSFIGGVIASDPCTRLCEFDGAKICTAGSWTKDGPGGSKICHAYHRKVPDGHCYHTTVTRVTCPSTSPPIQPSDADAIIAHLSAARAQGTTNTPAPTSAGTTHIVDTTTAHPGDATPGFYKSAYVSEADLDTSDLNGQEEGFRDLAHALIGVHYTDSNVGEISLGRRVFQAIEKSRKSLKRLPFVDPVKSFRLVRGHLLFDYAERNSMKDFEFIRAALLLPTLFRVDPADFERFRLESGLAAFCSNHAGYIRNAFLQNYHEGNRVGYIQGRPRWSEYVGANLPIYCPDLLNQFPELVPVVIEQRMYASVLDIDPPGLELGSLAIEGVSRTHAFTDSIQAIMDHDPVALRFHIANVRFAGEALSGQRVGREFVSVAAEEIFKVPESVYFRDSGDGVLEILATGELTHFEAIGRFIALSLGHDVSLGIRFPDCYLSLFLDQATEIAVEPEVKERLDLMVRGFQAVIPPQWNRDFLTVERLAQTFLGAPEIDAVDLVGNLRFSANPNLSGSPFQQIGWLTGYLESLSQDNLKKFTRLLCGRSVAPLGGFDAVRPPMRVLFQNHLGDLPVPLGSVSNIAVPLYETQHELIQRFNELLSGI